MPDLGGYVASGFARNHEHATYRDSMLWGVAPEYATAEVLLGGAYREFVVVASDPRIDLEKIDEIPDDPSLGLHEPERLLWHDIVASPTGLASPSPAGQKRKDGKPQLQLMPLVPEIARHANVLGGMRNRWNPGTLVAQTIAAGLEPTEWSSRAQSIAGALRVDAGDDVLARYVDETLRRTGGTMKTVDPLPPPAPWRVRGQRLTPAEQLVDDLAQVSSIKPDLTRRQWTVLMETALRVGMGLHVMWLMRLNWGLWSHLLEIAEGATPDRARIDGLWELHHEESLLDVGSDGATQVRRPIQKFVEARIGLNVLLHGLAAGGANWGDKLGSSGKDAPAELHDLAAHVSGHRSNLQAAISATLGSGLREAVSRRLDTRPSLIGVTSGYSNNIKEYLRYSLGQLNPGNPGLRDYDQGYLLMPDQNGRGTGRVEVGPTALILFGIAAAGAGDAPNVSLDQFEEHLRAYGIHLPFGELTTGSTIRSLERLGLTVESPDAGGGRMILSPLGSGTARA